MVEDFHNPDREVQELRPEDYLGLVRVTAEGKPEETKLVLTTLDGDEDYTVDSYMVQQSVGYGKDLVVPAGIYNLWVIEPEKKPTLWEQELEVPAGELTPVENRSPGPATQGAQSMPPFRRTFPSEGRSRWGNGVCRT